MRAALCACDYPATATEPPGSLAWHRAHRDHHLEHVPFARQDPVAIDNLDAFVAHAQAALEAYPEAA